MGSLAKQIQGQSDQVKMYKKGGAVEGSKKDVEGKGKGKGKEGSKKEEVADKKLKCGGTVKGKK
jgi:hypothetical protein